jgi:hypothetical protein
MIIDFAAQPQCRRVFKGLNICLDNRTDVVRRLRACLPSLAMEDGDKPWGGVELDSVQFLNTFDAYSDEKRHEILLLSDAVLSESKPILSAVGRQASICGRKGEVVMCGREPHLHRAQPRVLRPSARKN